MMNNIRSNQKILDRLNTKFVLWINKEIISPYEQNFDR